MGKACYKILLSQEETARPPAIVFNTAASDSWQMAKMIYCYILLYLYHLFRGIPGDWWHLLHVLPSKYQGYEEHRSGYANRGRMAPLGSAATSPCLLAAPAKRDHLMYEMHATSLHLFPFSNLRLTTWLHVRSCTLWLWGRTMPDGGIYIAYANL